jgi:hypothetical protein
MALLLVATIKDQWRCGLLKSEPRGQAKIAKLAAATGRNRPSSDAGNCRGAMEMSRSNDSDLRGQTKLESILRRDLRGVRLKQWG